MMHAKYHSELLALPFFETTHRSVASLANEWAQAALGAHEHAHDETSAAVDARCRALVAQLGEAGLTRYCVRQEFGGALPDFDARAICLVRETLAYYDGLADFVFAMQGLGSGAISLAGSPVLQRRYLPAVAAGKAIAAFALSEPEAGSDVAAMTCAAKQQGDRFHPRRHQDLDFEWRNRRLLLCVCPHRCPVRSAPTGVSRRRASARSWSRLPIRVSRWPGASSSMRRIPWRSLSSRGAAFPRTA